MAHCLQVFSTLVGEKTGNICAARQSLLEPGILRFDVVREADSPARFVLVEAYRDDLAPAAHKETAHYLRWRDAVEPMMAEPRRSVKYREIHPDAEAW